MKKAAPQGGCGVRRGDARLRNNDDRDRRRGGSESGHDPSLSPRATPWQRQPHKSVDNSAPWARKSSTGAVDDPVGSGVD